MSSIFGFEPSERRSRLFGLYYKRVTISWVLLFVKDTSKLGENNHNLKHCCSE